MRIFSIKNVDAYKYIYNNALTFKSQNESENSYVDVNVLLNRREKLISTAQKAKSYVNMAQTFNFAQEKKAMLNRINAEKKQAHIGVFYDIFSNVSKEIEDKHYNELYKKMMLIDFIKENVDFYRDVAIQAEELLTIIEREIEGKTGTNIAFLLKTLDTGVKKQTIPPQKQTKITQQIFSNAAEKIKKSDLKLQDLISMEEEWGSMSDNNPEKDKLGIQIYNLRKQLIQNNVSFIKPIPHSFNSEEDKINYIRTSLSSGAINLASAQDALQVFEKVGGRYTYGIGDSDDTMRDLSIFVERIVEKLDKKDANIIIQKYLELFNKFASIDGDNTDTRRLSRLIRKNNDKMSEETIFQLIDTLKEFSFEKLQAWELRKYIIENNFTKRSADELQRIKDKYAELDEIVKNMPQRNPHKPNG